MSQRSIKVLFASRLVEEKGVEILLKVLEKSLKDNKYEKYDFSIEWHIAGDSEYKDAILDIQKTHPSSLFYHGKLSQESIASLYRECDFLFMPSLFLETFGLTALESLASGAPVIGFQKGGLIPFIPDSLSISEKNAVEDFFDRVSLKSPSLVDVTGYELKFWKENLKTLFSNDSRITLFHDYSEKIGGAEVAVEKLGEALLSLEKNVSRYSYAPKTSPYKRRILFITSIFAFWRYFSVSRFLQKSDPTAIWLHSVMRYIGFWGLLAIAHYTKKKALRVFLSHHDVGFISPYPQDVHDESQIPHSFGLRDFLAYTHGRKKLFAIGKWCYVFLYRLCLPCDTVHILFAPFLENHIKNHFPQAKTIILPHSYDGTIFHP